MRVLFFGRYDPAYSRNAVLLHGLRLSGVEVIECSVEASARFWPFRLLWRYLRQRPVFDVMLVAFPGQEVMPLARFLTRKPVVFDAFTSHYEGYVQDRRVVAAGTWRARWYRFIDRWACRLASAVLTDTRAHAAYFASEFGIPERMLYPVLLGTMLSGAGGVSPAAGPFTVHFHGSNIPLQGIEVIWGAVRRLWNEDIRFQMFGPFTVPHELLPHVHYESYVPFPELAERIGRAHVSLGIFGTSSKAQRVIPNKVYEALAVVRPVITADTPAIRELLTSASAVLIPVGDADALARAILRLRSDAQLRTSIASAGHEALRVHAAPAIVGAHVREICERLTLPA
ncbi:MAG: glycosyltransferase [Candidatus Yanofskybacteria bacterium]|nr:glycosyltransferase [Candidatus Yanofskybacteria bacterium]